ncbi:M20/M25/M40 family metallo-hydrolase [Mumia zhuanghuii]|uniref:M20/M25/M40 family metallo-hydrolase n=2 Tax=Mumia TaxID=1546255 RepID=A0ABW1QN89_9ACTN|nr:MULTISPECIES: M20/M25/M40 family metallo-hydrolase [Mumia]KAA1419784.1 M20/M25/M40 family metallo-hydrolase [Mumia zhuanghuii]
MSTAAENLSALIGCRTVSSRDADGSDPAEFERFRTTFAGLYPRLHADLELTRFGGGLLFCWRGASSERPVVLMAHYDVVPVVPEDWDRDPFSGEIADGAVHGRGALDDKGHLVAVAEAVESLLADGFTPAHDVYLCFGDTEEISGETAEDIANHLAAQGVRPWLVNDEGGAVVQGAFPGVKVPTAMVGVSEKGIVDVVLETTAPGGHASTPARNGATARLARAIVRIDDHPFPARLSAPVVQMLEAIAPHTPPPLRQLLANADRFNRPVAQILAKVGVETAAVVRTTTTTTQLSGSPGANVIASRAWANVNIRIAVGETVASVVERIRSVVADGSVSISVREGMDPSPVSRTDNDACALLSDTITATYPDAAVVPYVQNGATDSRHFAVHTDAVYRFSPFMMSREQRDSIHTANEYLRIEDLERGVAFFRTLLRNHA